MKKEVAHYYPKNALHWRRWLQKNHHHKNAVWLIFYKKGSGMPTLNISEAIDQALCFGWIDGKGVTINEESYGKYFCKRKTNGTWSKINKEKVERLIASNQMTTAGLACIEAAKKNGSWIILDEVEKLLVPKDLSKALGLKLLKKFKVRSKSEQRFHLQNLVLAKTEKTRKNRIAEIIKKLCDTA